VALGRDYQRFCGALLSPDGMVTFLPFDIRPQPSIVTCLIEISSSDRENRSGRIFFSSLKGKSIQLKERDANREARPFVPVNEWMIANQTGRVEGSQLNHIRRGIGAMLAWTRQGRV
jgi:hypothetical protein